MLQGSELLPWLWRVPLALLLWNTINLAGFAHGAVKRRVTGRVVGSSELFLGGWTIDLLAVRGRLRVALIYTLAASFVVGVGVIVLTLGLRFAGRASLAHPDVRFALWIAGADVALPAALAVALVIRFFVTPFRI